MMTDTDDRHIKDDGGSKEDVVENKKSITKMEALELISKCEKALKVAENVLSQGRVIAEKNGLSVDSSILDASYQSPFMKNQSENGGNIVQSGTNRNCSNNDSTSNHTSNTGLNNKRQVLNAFPILSTTGGYSNTDHIIQITGDKRHDTIAEYKRALKHRARTMQPEQRGQDRWDQPRIAGSRRRRITREQDLPSAPPEPPNSGYIIFVAQMTAKIRHDRPHVRHNQIAVVREISQIWRYRMSDAARDYYNNFAREARVEYKLQHTEFRATGSYTPSTVFSRLHGDGPWIRISDTEKNALEREISSYETVKFPPRPIDVDKPHWEKKIELAHEREKARKIVRQHRQKLKETIRRQRLIQASKAKKEYLQK
jgi:hypothetical protein